jgi:hypothetical protein
MPYQVDISEGSRRSSSPNHSFSLDSNPVSGSLSESPSTAAPHLAPESVVVGKHGDRTASTFCDNCQYIFGHWYEESKEGRSRVCEMPFHPDPSTITANAEGGCPLCAQVMGLLESKRGGRGMDITAEETIITVSFTYSESFKRRIDWSIHFMVFFERPATTAEVIVLTKDIVIYSPV